MDLTKYVASIENFPEDGIIFRDVTPLMADKEAFKETIDRFVEWTKSLDTNVDIVAGPEARGFLFGCPVAYKVNAGNCQHYYQQIGENSSVFSWRQIIHSVLN